MKEFIKGSDWSKYSYRELQQKLSDIRSADSKKNVYNQSSYKQYDR